MNSATSLPTNQAMNQAASQAMSHAVKRGVSRGVNHGVSHAMNRGTDLVMGLAMNKVMSGAIPEPSNILRAKCVIRCKLRQKRNEAVCWAKSGSVKWKWFDHITKLDGFEQVLRES
ncbi:MAG: hypothetical protein FWD57_08065 [Polyangiaceae bacterium]|nr:hypothetical protein [Polyangiaceae bacterium]